ncbi:MAG: putative DNA-binding domain-containing protein [Bosea sp.]|uniref:HvfC/BufC N-terminal domain-containing protein n=1 Tax=Bosea sp. (in: a-proteobacteria) TaxID=1871050 RepID=UPI001ACC03AB|nr:DNA-binding domain-containing protein [Bosea sp. (in: a-proteobacteria)]MBN9469668.1 putative DNA-binding domain-containing protein [Bosea sp. (in: a-proteobacteria)]
MRSDIRIGPSAGNDGSYASAFAPGLNDPERQTPALVSGPGGKKAVKRYNVYRNNVTVGLIDALAAIYPATRRITGDEFFRAMARFHIRQTPPKSPLLFDYGRDFPDFIAGYAYAEAMPWLADTARIERAWLDAYHAADAEPLPPGAFASIPPESLADVSVALHPSTRVVRSRYAALTIFAANRSPEPVGAINAAEAEEGLITRPDLDVIVTRLPAGGAALIEALAAGLTLGVAMATVLASDPHFDIAAALAGIVEAGAVTALSPGDAR